MIVRIHHIVVIIRQGRRFDALCNITIKPYICFYQCNISTDNNVKHHDIPYDVFHFCLLCSPQKGKHDSMTSQERSNNNLKYPAERRFWHLKFLADIYLIIVLNAVNYLETNCFFLSLNQLFVSISIFSLYFVVSLIVLLSLLLYHYFVTHRN
jgi:hypothetical protein